MFFNDSIDITWKGKKYTCPVNMKLVKTMESHGFNAAVTNARCAMPGVPPLSLVAEMVQWLLLSGGCSDVSEDEVYAELMNNSMEESNIEIIKAAKPMSELFIPKIETSDRAATGEKKK